LGRNWKAAACLDYGKQLTAFKLCVKACLCAKSTAIYYKFGQKRYISDSLHFLGHFKMLFAIASFLKLQFCRGLLFLAIATRDNNLNNLYL